MYITLDIQQENAIVSRSKWNANRFLAQFECCVSSVNSISYKCQLNRETLGYMYIYANHLRFIIPLYLIATTFIRACVRELYRREGNSNSLGYTIVLNFVRIIYFRSLVCRICTSIHNMLSVSLYLLFIFFFNHFHLPFIN